MKPGLCCAKSGTKTESEVSELTFTFCVYVYSNDVERLKELQADLTTQHHIAADLLSEVCKRFQFPYQRQCVLDTVSIVAATISNLQKLETALSHMEDVSKKELDNLHVAVGDHVQRLVRELKPWLAKVLPYSIRCMDHPEHVELRVSK